MQKFKRHPKIWKTSVGGVRVKEDSYLRQKQQQQPSKLWSARNRKWQKLFFQIIIRLLRKREIGKDGKMMSDKCGSWLTVIWPWGGGVGDDGAVIRGIIGGGLCDLARWDFSRDEARTRSTRSWQAFALERWEWGQGRWSSWLNMDRLHRQH